MKDYKKLCHTCAEKEKQYRPLRYALGRCEKCGTYTGVAEVEYYPEIVEELFGHLTKPKE